MATVGSDIAVYLQSLSLGTFGTTLFRDILPPTPDVCGAVFESGGAPPTPGFGVVGIAHETPSVQIRFRGAPDDSPTPAAKAQTAYQALQRVGVTLSGTFYHWLRPMQPPFILERDANKRVVWAFNVLTQRAL
jgi:hypothetical protein